MAPGEVPEVVVLGGGLSRFALERPDGTPVDWIVEAGLAALADAGVEIGAIDHSLVAYESEILARQLTMGQVAQDALALCPRPSVRVEAGGATGGVALRSALAYLRGGLCESILVLGADAVGRQVPATTVRQVYAMSGDVDFEMAAGGFFSAYYALMIQEHMRRYGTREDQMARVSVKNHRNARSNPMAAMPLDLTVDEVLASPPVATPYKRLDCAVLADGAAALVLATRRWAAAHARAWRERPRVIFTGSGCGTDRMRLGDRPRPYPGLAHFRAKREAAQMAYAMAGITNPRREIDVAEVADPYTGAELQAYEELGFCGYGESGPLAERGVFDLGGELPTNTSGGLIGQGAPPGAMGIAQAVEILRQLRGECPPARQVPGARRGLTDIHGGTASLSVVSIFERRDR
jgi:acetyl-CoA C-acetyltransferase